MFAPTSMMTQGVFARERHGDPERFHGREGAEAEGARGDAGAGVACGDVGVGVACLGPCSDDFVDDLNRQIFRELLTFMLETPNTISSRAMKILFISKYIEPICRPRHKHRRDGGIGQGKGDKAYKTAAGKSGTGDCQHLRTKLAKSHRDCMNYAHYT